MSVMVAPRTVLAARYPAGMATRDLLGITDVRRDFKTRVALAQAGEDAVHTVLVVHGTPRGVLVSVPWRRAAAEALGEPVSLDEVPIIAATTLRDALNRHVGEHVLAMRHSDPAFALVPWDFYLRASKALGEPVDI